VGRVSDLDHEQTSRHVFLMSAIPLKVDIRWRGLRVRFVPIADIRAGRRSRLGLDPSFVLRCIADFGRPSAWRDHEDEIP